MRVSTDSLIPVQDTQRAPFMRSPFRAVAGRHPRRPRVPQTGRRFGAFLPRIAVGRRPTPAGRDLVCRRRHRLHCLRPARPDAALARLPAGPAHFPSPVGGAPGRLLHRTGAPGIGWPAGHMNGWETPCLKIAITLLRFQPAIVHRLERSVDLQLEGGTAKPAHVDRLADFGDATPVRQGFALVPRSMRRETAVRPGP